MEFQSLPFLLFFPAVALTCWLLPRGWRNAFMLVVSLAFYTMWRPLASVFLLWMIGVSWMAAHAVDAQAGHRKRWLWGSIVMMIAPLAFFKFLTGINEALLAAKRATGWCIDFKGLNWAIPAGLSTYSLQAVSYVVDVYKRRVPREPSLLNHALYLSFFPTVMSGPLNRSFDLMPQLREQRLGFDPSLVGSGARMLVWGMFLKVAVADRFAIYTNSVFSNPDMYNGLTIAFALICFIFELYCDFAGYSCIAIGLGRLLGVRIKDNFRRPFFAMGIGEIWHRWHIALSGWLRDYVYIPLGGSRCSRWCNVRNVMVTFFVSGMWHGGTLPFFLWGFCQGVCVSAEQFLPMKWMRNHAITRIPMTILSVMVFGLLFVFFQDTWDQLLVGMFTRWGPWHLRLPVHMAGVLTTMAVMAVIVLAKDANDEFHLLRTPPRWVSLVFYVLIVLVILLEGVFDAGQFIYVRF